MAGAEAYLRGPLRRSLLVKRIREDPISRLAVWSWRFALFAIVVLLLAIVIGRNDLLEIIPTLAVIGGALIVSTIAVLLALGAFTVIWRDGLAGFGIAIAGFIIGVGILGYPTFLGIKAYRLPAISDITTDPIDPPLFEVIARLRSRDANPILYAGLYAQELQKAAYPIIQPVFLPVPPEVAFEAVMSVMTRRKLRPVDARPPLAARPGRIEVVFRTLFMGFRDDVVIRIRRDPEGARIDLRSASRYGRHDFGTNAARIAALSEDIEEAVATLAPEKPPPDLPTKGTKKGPEPKSLKPGEKRR